MRILVCVKHALDPKGELRPAPDGQRVETDGAAPVYGLGPADRCALEEAVRWRERWGGEVTALTLGPERAVDALRECLGRGADRGVHLLCAQDQDLDGLDIALQISPEARRGGYDLILCGEASPDGNGGQVGPMLAELLGLPQVTRAVRLEVDPGRGMLTAERLLERGSRERLECPLPALACVTAQTNEPRYVSVYRRAGVPDAKIERVPVDAGDSGRGSTCRAEVGLPRPRARKVPQPSAALSASDRMSFLLSGGRPQKPGGSGGIFSGSPAEAAERIIQYLQEKGLV